MVTACNRFQFCTFRYGVSRKETCTITTIRLKAASVIDCHIRSNFLQRFAVLMQRFAISSCSNRDAVSIKGISITLNGAKGGRMEVLITTYNKFTLYFQIIVQHSASTNHHSISNCLLLKEA